MKSGGVLFTVLVMLAGCQLQRFPAAALRERLPGNARMRDAPPDLVPQQVVAIWSDAIYEQPGRPSVRGFGGRVYFYNAQQETIPVEGQLVIYAYDDSERASQEERTQVPDRKFVFRSHELEQHYSPTDLGPSYNIWLPWDEIGGYQRTVGLLPVFTGKQGNVAVGNQSVSILPGKSPPQGEVRRTGHFTTLGGERIPGPHDLPAGINAVSAGGARNWQYADPGVTSPMRTTTIGLPMCTTQRLIAGATQAAAANPSPDDRAVKTTAGQPRDTLPGVLSNSAADNVSATDPSPPARFERPRYRVPRAGYERLAPVPAVTSPGPGAPPPGPPFGPAPGPSPGVGESDPNGSGSAQD